MEPRNPVPHFFALLEEKSATIRGLMETMRKNTKTRTAMQKKINQTDKVRRLLVTKKKGGRQPEVSYADKNTAGGSTGSRTPE